MKINYVPILKAKQGEFDALSTLSVEDRKNITPWFDVSVLDDEKRKKLLENGKQPIVTYLDSVAVGIANSCSTGSTYIDLPKWPTNGQTEYGEHVNSYLLNKLSALGVNTIPVIDHDSWEDPIYANVYKKLPVKANQKYCLRISMNIDTIEDLSDPDYFRQQIENITVSLGLDRKQTIILIDFADISSGNRTVPDIMEEVTTAISILAVYNFEHIMMSGCSLPPFISSAVKSQNSSGTVTRKEMIAWQAILKQFPKLNLTFSDYGVRNPSSGEKAYGNTNGKIRYTTKKSYFIVRGYPLKTGAKGAQHYDLSKKVVDSAHYQDRQFSWGDDRIFRCSQKEFKGRPHDWIAIDTNHHIKMVLVEIFEFQQQLATQNSDTATKELS